MHIFLIKLNIARNNLSFFVLIFVYIDTLCKFLEIFQVISARRRGRRSSVSSLSVDDDYENLPSPQGGNALIEAAIEEISDKTFHENERDISKCKQKDNISIINKMHKKKALLNISLRSRKNIFL